MTCKLYYRLSQGAYRGQRSAEIQ